MWHSYLPSKTILIAVLISLLASVCQAQENRPVTPPHTARLGLGFSATGILSDIANYFRLVNGVDLNKYPVIGATYLYSPFNRVGVGAGIAYQHFSLTYRDPTASDPQRYGLLANKWNFGVVGHFYYVRRSTFRLYSGARLGMSNWNIDTETGFPIDALDRIINFALGSVFAPQFIILGGETWFSPHIGAHGELAIGAPHVLSFGLSYRW